MSYLERLLNGVSVEWLPLAEFANYEQPTRYLVESNNYNNNLFVCDFENMDYFWLCKLYNKKSSVELVK